MDLAEALIDAGFSVRTGRPLDDARAAASQRLGRSNRDTDVRTLTRDGVACS